MVKASSYQVKQRVNSKVRKQMVLIEGILVYYYYLIKLFQKHHKHIKMKRGGGGVM
jgi:hypothetical protein